MAAHLRVSIVRPGAGDSRFESWAGQLSYRSVCVLGGASARAVRWRSKLCLRVRSVRRLRSAVVLRWAGLRARRGGRRSIRIIRRRRRIRRNNRSREEKTTGSKTKTRVPDAGSQQLVAAEAAGGCDLLLQALGLPSAMPGPVSSARSEAPHACDPGSTPGVRTFPRGRVVLATSRCNGVSRKLVQRLAGGC